MATGMKKKKKTYELKDALVGIGSKHPPTHMPRAFLIVIWELMKAKTRIKN